MFKEFRKRRNDGGLNTPDGTPNKKIAKSAAGRKRKQPGGSKSGFRRTEEGDYISDSSDSSLEIVQVRAKREKLEPEEIDHRRLKSELKVEPEPTSVHKPKSAKMRKPTPVRKAFQAYFELADDDDGGDKDAGALRFV
jgi:hypothetical protein